MKRCEQPTGRGAPKRQRPVDVPWAGKGRRFTLMFEAFAVRDEKPFLSGRPAEGFTSRIQALKGATMGFRNFENYRTIILFFCGKLDLMPGT